MVRTIGWERPISWLIASVTLAAAVLAGPAPPQNVRIAAASDLQFVLPTIAAQFERDTGSQVTLTFGSSGNFVAQIENGAPFDLFLSADVDYPRKLERAGLVEPGTLYEYAAGRLALWARRDSPVDVRGGLAILADARVRRIAIANPAHAPYGRAAVAALRHEGLFEQVQAKLVLGENVSQAAQFAESGSADVGILATALALSPALKSAGVYSDIAPTLHPPIEQGAVIIATSAQKALAARFIEALKRPASLRTLQSYGFAAPAAQPR